MNQKTIVLDTPAEVRSKRSYVLSPSDRSSIALPKTLHQRLLEARPANMRMHVFCQMLLESAIEAWNAKHHSSGNA